MLVAFAVSLTFFNRKNGKNHQRSTQESTGNPLLNPTLQLAALVRMLRNYPDYSDSASTCALVNKNNVLQAFNQTRALLHLPSAPAAIGEEVLRFSPVEISEKFVQSSAAMG